LESVEKTGGDWLLFFLLSSTSSPISSSIFSGVRVCVILYNARLDYAEECTRAAKERTVQLRTVTLVVMLALIILMAPVAADAQEVTKVHRIGWLLAGS
jgi:uncharacterized membrane protein